MQQIYLDTDFKIELMTGFMAGNKRLKKVTLSQNMINNLELLSQMYINRSMKELSLVLQQYFKTTMVTPKMQTLHKDEPKNKHLPFESQGEFMPC